jgi:tRNA-specific 2-thiouridylase
MKEKVGSKTVLIAMTGGLESTVAAYLLKKQGYKCIGIGLQLFGDGEETGPFADVAVLDLNKIKKICQFLDIPFYAVNAKDIFADKVLDPLIGRILSGQTFEPLVYLNAVLLEILLEKAQKFQTTLVATAHYAKVLKNQKTGTFELFVGNDLEHDQSYSLAKLEQRHLENLILPLSEIRKKEVEKISELIKVEFIPRIKSKSDHIMHDPRMANLVEARAPRDLKRLGTIYDYSTEGSICEHKGIHHYYVGQSGLSFDKKSEIQIDPLKQVISIVSYKGNIFIDYPTRLKYQHALVTQFNAAANLDFSMPIMCYVKMAPKGEKIPCCLSFKNNNMALVEFLEPRSGLLVAGQFMVFYNRQLEKGKVIGSALVEVGGMFSEFSYNTLPERKEDVDGEGDAYGQSANNIDRMHF